MTVTPHIPRILSYSQHHEKHGNQQTASRPPEPIMPLPQPTFSGFPDPTENGAQKLSKRRERKNEKSSKKKETEP
jgi:hypothetical protein